jgi:hypothetical protein
MATKRKSIKTKKKPVAEGKREYRGETEGKFLMGWHSFLPPRQELNVDSKTGAKIGTNQRLGVITGRMLVEIDGVVCIVNTKDEVRFENGELSTKEIVESMNEVKKSIAEYYKKGATVLVKVYEWTDTGRREYKEVAD